MPPRGDLSMTVLIYLDDATKDSEAALARRMFAQVWDEVRACVYTVWSRAPLQSSGGAGPPIPARLVVVLCQPRRGHKRVSSASLATTKIRNDMARVLLYR